MFNSSASLPNSPNIHQVWYFRSLERGFWSRLQPFRLRPRSRGLSVNTLPQRLLWSQEPANVFLQKFSARKTSPPPGEQPKDLPGEIYDLVAEPHYDDVTCRSRVRRETRNQNRVNMVLEHSLPGFGNKSYGLLYDATVPGAKHANEPAGSPTSSAAPSPALANVVAWNHRHEPDVVPT